MTSRFYSETEIVTRVKELHNNRHPLNISAIRRSHPKLLESAFVKKNREPFFGWKRALERAGIDYGKIHTELTEFVICEICGAHLKMVHNHAAYRHGVPIKEYRLEFPEAEVMSDLSRAIKCRSFQSQKILPHWEPFWTPEYILDRAYAFYEAGFPVHFRSIEQLDGGIANAVADWKFELGSWNDILKRIGLNPDSIRMRNFSILSPEEVIDRIRDREACGIPLNFTSICAGLHADYPLLGAANQFFNSWENALAAAGFDIAEARIHKNLYDSPQKVIDALKARQNDGLAMNHGTVHEENAALENKMYRYFGSWDNALRAADIAPASVRTKVNRRRFQTSDEVVRAIKKRIEMGLSVNARSLWEGQHRDATLIISARLFFESWDAALEAAGITPQKSRFNPAKRFPTPESVIACLLDKIEKGQPVNQSAVKSDSILLKWARTYFGSYGKALSAAGIPEERARTPRRKSRYENRKSVVRAIRERQKNGKPLKRILLQKGPDADALLYRRAREFFGDWNEALEAARIDPQSIVYIPKLTYPHADAVRKEILSRRERGLSLNTTKIQKGEQSDHLLFRAARRFFITWDSALKDAGIDSAETAPVRRKYLDTRSVVEEI